MSKAKLEECKKLIGKAEKLAKGGFFTKKKPNEAEKVYNEAKKIIRFLKPITKESTLLYLEILNGLITVQNEQSYYNSAGKSCEESARLCNDSKFNDIKIKTYKYYEKAGYYYQINKQYDYASQQIKKAALILGETDINGAIELFKKCISINEDELRHRQTDEFFDAAIRFCINNKKYKIAIEFLERQVIQQEFNAHDLRERIHRNTASIVILYCFLKDVKSAQKIYYDHLERFSELGDTNELSLATQILTIFEEKDDIKLNELKKKQDIGIYLLSCIGRLVKRELNLDGITKQEKPKINFNNNNNNNNNNIKPMIDDEFKKNVDPNMLKSDINNGDIKIDNDGKPDLLIDEPPDLLIDGDDDDNNDVDNDNNDNNNNEKNKDDNNNVDNDNNDNNNNAKIKDDNNDNNKSKNEEDDNPPNVDDPE